MAARKKTRSRSGAGKNFSLAAAIILLSSAGALVWMAVNGRFDGWQQKSWAEIKSETIEFFRESDTNQASTPLRSMSKMANAPIGSSNSISMVTVKAKTNAPPNESLTGVMAQTNKVVTLNLPSTPEEPKKIEPLSPGERPVRNLLEAQVALARKGISSGCIDGAPGSQTRRALMAYQVNEKLPVTGELDAATRESLTVEEPVFFTYTVTEGDLKRLHPARPTWMGKSEQPRLEYESILEYVAEKGRSHVEFIRKLNPGVDWKAITAGTRIKLPKVETPSIREKAAFIRIQLASKTLQAFGKATNLLAHFPCSIARKVEKRPVGTLSVIKLAGSPNYVFNPSMFPESQEARTINRKLILPPGPNNPVGTAWIGLDRPGYGIHGSPKPEEIGRSESHGCFRLANWNAEHLLQLAWAGLPVHVEP
ncbi:MAG: L,D-transpeptidase family protein [Verrucomicrobiales bacterium]